MIFALLTAVMMGVGDVFTKIASHSLKSTRILILNAVFTLPVSLMYFALFNGSLPSGALLLKTAAIQSLSVVAMLFMFLAMTEGPVSVIAAVLAGYSAIGVIGGALIFKEMPTLIQYGGIVLVLAGSVAICYIPSNKHIKAGIWILWTALATLMWGVWSVMTKSIVNDVEPWTIGLVFAVIAPVIWLPYILVFRKKETHIKWTSKAVLAGLLSVIIINGGGIMFYISLKNLPISIAAPVAASNPLYTVVISYIFLKERLHVHQIISLFAIMAGLILLR